MKYFLYLDYDIVNSIVAQNEKGIISQITTENGVVDEKQNNKKLDSKIDGTASTSLLKLAEAEASLDLGGEIQTEKRNQRTTKEIIAKSMHDALFDIAYKAIKPITLEYGQNKTNSGAYIEMTRVFDFVDFEYLNAMFSKNGVIEYIKKVGRENIHQSMTESINNNLNREQKRKGADEIKKKQAEIIKENEKQYDDIHDIITVIENIIPYNKMLVANDGYVIPVEDKYFRVNPQSLGFMYGGEIHVVGMVTNIISSGKESKDANNVFATIQFSVNEALRHILPTQENNLYVVSPIAIYYE